MIEDLARYYSADDAKLANLLGVPCMTLAKWRMKAPPSWSARRLVWLTWTLLLHPERLRTLFDLVTWSRFQRPIPPPRNPEDWSGWEI